MPKKTMEKYYLMNKLDNNIGEIKIYGDITSWAWSESDVDALGFAKELETLKNCTRINMRVNSGGGDIFEATAIYNKLKSFIKENNIELIAYIDGLAASAASFLIMAASKVIAGRGTMVMIHKVKTWIAGNSDTLEKTANFLKKAEENIIDIYMTKVNMTREELREKMTAETWYPAEEALAAGFVNDIEDYENEDETKENIKNILESHAINHYTHKENAMMVLNKALENINKNDIQSQKKKEEIEKMPKNLMELKNQFPAMLEEYKKEVLDSVDNTEVINKAILAERERIKNLDSIKIFNDAQKEIVNKAKFEEPRDHRDIALEFYNSAPYQAAAEIEKTEKERVENGFYDIPAGGDTKTTAQREEEEIINAALTAFNGGVK